MHDAFHPDPGLEVGALPTRFAGDAINAMLPAGLIARATFSLLAALACTLPVNTCAQRTGAVALELVVPFGPGGGADTLGRATAKQLAGILAEPIQVSNIPGATGRQGISKLVAAPADGRTLAVLTADTFTLQAYVNPRWKLSDVILLGIMMKQPSALLLPSNSRFKNWGEFEKEARLHPGTLRVAITGLGSPDYLTLQQLEAKGIKLVPVPLANPEERTRAPFEGKADALYEQPGDVARLATGQQLRPVLAFNAARLPSLPEVPSSQELGFGQGFDQFRAIVVRAGTDPSRVKVLSDALEKLAGLPEYRQFLKATGAAEDSFVPARSAGAFLQARLEALRKVADEMPLHARYLYDEGQPEIHIQQF
jgi:tripartite-type tricarboxylate transporter receptor subunit TctC